MSLQKFVAYFLGPPGSGKGARGVELLRMTERMGVTLTLDVMSDLLKSGWAGVDQDWHRQNVLSYMERGQLVPGPFVSELVESRLRWVHDQQYILDGFPRNMYQACEVVRMARQIERDGRECRVVVLNTDLGICRSRALERKRPDDTLETINDRLREWQEVTMPGINHLASMGLDVSFVPPGDSPAEGAEIILRHLLRD